MNQRTLRQSPCNLPSLLSNTYIRILTAQSTQPHGTRDIHGALCHQHWPCQTSHVIPHTRDDHWQPTPAVHLSIRPLHRHRQQLHCPAHTCTLRNAPTLSSDVALVVYEPYHLFPMYPHISTANGTNRNAA